MRRSCLSFMAGLLGTLAACGAPTPLPYPDAAQPTGLSLRATPQSLVIRPASSGRVSLLLVDPSNAPVPAHPISLLIEGASGPFPPAWLSATEVLTNQAGIATVQIITQALPPGTDSLPLFLRAEPLGTPPLYIDLIVSPNAHSLRIYPKVAEQVLGNNTVVSVHLAFYDAKSCHLLPLTSLPKAVRPVRTILLGNESQFSGISAKQNHAVVAMGYDAGGTLRIGGCLDIQGSVLAASDDMRATIFLDWLFPNLAGTYPLRSSLRFHTPPQPTLDLESEWRMLSLCPYDPARLWLDCTIDALGTSDLNDPLDCVPLAGQEGAIGKALESRRGARIAPLGSTIALGSPCHDRLDSSGQASLEVQVDSLFSENRTQLQNSQISALPNELRSLFSEIDVESSFKLTATPTPNRYLLEHTLKSVIFPDANPRISPIHLLDIGAPLTTVGSIPITLRKEQIAIPTHAFTLRLGTLARTAFDSASLRNRGFSDIQRLITTVFDWAERMDAGSRRRGCYALDALLCDTVAQPKGCVLSACSAGLAALIQKLEKSFFRLNGASQDLFFRSGASSVFDLNNDGKADSLGTQNFPGLWSAEVFMGVTGYQVFGSWTSSR